MPLNEVRSWLDLYQSLNGTSHLLMAMSHSDMLASLNGADGA